MHYTLIDRGRKRERLIIYKRSNQRARNQFRTRTGKGGNTSYQLRQYAEATLGGGSLRKVVKLPEGEDENEWLAVNMVDFYNQINLLYGAITEFCSPQSCPEMKATDELSFLTIQPRLPSRSDMIIKANPLTPKTFDKQIRVPLAR